MTDIIIVAVLAVVLGCAIRYLYKAKKRGATCVGCSCGSKDCCSGSCCSDKSK